MYRFGKRTSGILNFVNKYLNLCAEETIKTSVIDISIADWGGLRTAEIQYDLFKKGYSKAQGFTTLSYHQKTDDEGKSLALDLCAYFQGEINYNFQRLVYINTLYICTWSKLKALGKIPNNLFLNNGLFWKASSNNESNMGWDLGHHQISLKRQKPTLI
jgi:hypothetical protein